MPSRRMRLGILGAIIALLLALVGLWLALWPSEPDFFVYHRAGDIGVPVAIIGLVATSVGAYYLLFPSVIDHRDRGAIVATLLLGLAFVAARGLTAGVNELLAEPREERVGRITGYERGAPRRGSPPRDTVILQLERPGEEVEASFEVHRWSDHLQRFPVGARVRAIYQRGPWFDWGRLVVVDSPPHE